MYCVCCMLQRYRVHSYVDVSMYSTFNVEQWREFNGRQYRIVFYRKLFGNALQHSLALVRIGKGIFFCGFSLRCCVCALFSILRFHFDFKKLPTPKCCQFISKFNLIGEKVTTRTKKKSEIKRKKKQQYNK